MVNWIKKETLSKPVLTISDKFFSFNTNATYYLNDFMSVRVGMDDNYLYIQGIKKKDLERNTYFDDSIFKIYQGKGYSRIASKDLLLLVDNNFESKYKITDNLPCKFEGEYIPKENLLRFNIGGIK